MREMRTTLAALFMSTSACAQEEVLLETAPEPNFIRHITTQALEIKAACPQLQNIALEQISFDRIPVSEDVLTLYITEYVPMPTELDHLHAKEVDSFRFALRQGYELDTLMVHINSLGGSTDVGMPLANDIYYSRSNVITYVSDHAASVAFSI